MEMKTNLIQCAECKRVFTSNSVNPICPNCDDRNQWPEVIKICEIEIK